MKYWSVEQKAYNHFLARQRYTAKRQSKEWKKRKKDLRFRAEKQKVKARRQKQKKPVSIIAPKQFSLVSNTNEVLEYFVNAEKELKKGSNIVLDISDVDTLTADTIALMVATINNPDFQHECRVSGNAPKKPNLYELFTQSGFYDHVLTNGGFKTNQENLLHKEVKRGVKPDVAVDAYLTGIKHVFNETEQFEPLYEILIECMSNTNDHADLVVAGKCRWWLYVYSYPNEKRTSYSFLDLGVGIFKSAVVQNHLKKLFKGTPLYKNINLVDDLLAGKIQSRVTGRDHQIRGKGIPQIVEHSTSTYFKEFYIITNDVKINLKTGEREQLNYQLKGTFLYWELEE